jgi:hypothetical protein
LILGRCREGKAVPDCQPRSAQTPPTGAKHQSSPYERKRGLLGPALPPASALKSASRSPLIRAVLVQACSEYRLGYGATAECRLLPIADFGRLACGRWLRSPPCHSTAARRGVERTHERMSEVGERATTAKCHLLGQNDKPTAAYFPTLAPGNLGRVRLSACKCRRRAALMERLALTRREARRVIGLSLDQTERDHWFTQSGFNRSIFAR